MPALPKVGDEFAGYRLLAVLGRGGMSVVYRAEHPRLGSLTALKVLAPELADNDMFRARFLYESRVAAALNHPNVVPIYDMGTHDDLLYIAMRYVSGSDLAAIIQRRKNLTPPESLFVVGQAGRALDLAHQRGLVHRDVKPGNILVESGADADDCDHVYLADFGIAKHALSRSGLTDTGQFLGTVDYVAPEQIQSGDVGAAADIYSLGCMLFQCLTGRVPFVRDLGVAVLWAHVGDPPPPASSLRPGLPPAIDEVIARALAKDPADRYQSSREMMVDARAAFDNPDLSATRLLPRDPAQASAPHTGSTAHPATPARAVGAAPATVVPPPPPPPRSAQGPPQEAGAGPRRSWSTVIAAAAVVLVLAAAVLAGFWLFPDDESSSGPGADTPEVDPASNPLLAAIDDPHKPLLPLDSCEATAPDHVVCHNPADTITEVELRRYPDLDSLYDAYVAAATELSGHSLVVNQDNCNRRHQNGEISWVHEFRHPRGISLDESRSGRLDPMEGQGRLFCIYTDDGEHVVWTDNAGLVLGTVTGFDHHETWRWWREVHHQLPVGHFAGESGTEPEPHMPGTAPEHPSGSPPSTSASDMGSGDPDMEGE